MFIVETKEATFEVHTDVSEVRFSDLCDFCTYDAKVLDGKEEDKDEYILKAVSYLVENANELPMYSAESGVPGYKVDLLKQISVVDLYLYYSNLFNSYFDVSILPALRGLHQDKLTEQQKIILANLADTPSIYEKSRIVMMFTEFFENVKVVDSYYQFYYKNHWYYIDSKRSNNFFYGKQFTAGEVVEVKEFRRRLEDKAKAPNLDEGELMFRLELHDLAVLALRKGETLPYDKVERENFINARMKHFQDITVDIVYNVCFFLINSLQKHITHHITQDFGVKHLQT